ncbi:MAG: 3-hydroxyacyl-ACP dehydratase FabZ [Alphaproteobacteria bacterium GM202ARS2]|nr:3-hydroxyacyl-ACP dehydratase FabZ [Alphaproteobacteria bacterium GM202ARS2]
MMKRTTLSCEDLQRLLPHRYPFMMLDRLTDIVPRERALGIKNVSINEPFFQGHFPRKPIMPGVLILEALAQSAGALVMHSLGYYDEDRIVYFMSVEKLRFRNPVYPGDVLLLQVEKVFQRGAVWRFKGDAIIDNEDTSKRKIATEAVYTAIISDD